MPLSAHQKLFSIGEASSILNVSADTLRRSEKNGKIKTTRGKNNERLYSLDDVILLKGILKKRLPTQKMYSVKQTANFLNVSSQTIRRWEREGRIKATRSAGGHRRFTPDSIQTVKDNKYQQVQKITKDIIPTQQAPIPQTPYQPNFPVFKLISFATIGTLLVGFIILSLNSRGNIKSTLLEGIGNKIGKILPGYETDYKYEGDVKIKGTVTIEGIIEFLDSPHFTQGAVFGSSTLSIDNTGNLTTDQTITANSLTIVGAADMYRLNVGSSLTVAGNEIINSSGKIPALNGFYFENLSGENITNVDAHHLGGQAASSFLRSNEPDTMEAVLTLTASPGSVNVNGGPLYINPSASSTNYTLFGVAVDGVSKFKVDTEGDISLAGSIASTGARVTKGWFTDLEVTNTPTFGGIAIDSTFLKLDASNDPITGDLLLKPTTNSTTTFQVQKSDTTPVFNVDTTNGRVGIGIENPEYKLDIKGTASTDSISTYTGLNLNFVLEPTSGSVALVEVAGNIEAGTQYYLISYKTALGETVGYYVGNVTTDATHEQVDVALPVSSDERVTGRVIYRSNVYYSTAVELVTINDNTTTTYRDNTATVDITSTRNGYYRSNTTNKAIMRNGVSALITGINFTGLGLNSAPADGGGNSVHVGYNAGSSITTGRLNTFVGHQAGQKATTASSNVSLGYQALFNNVSSSGNIAIGRQALINSTLGFNIGIGRYAGFANTTGQKNVFIGDSTAGSTSGAKSYNVFVGINAGRLSEGSNNVFLGFEAGENETGSNKLYISSSDTSTPLIYGEFDNNLFRINGKGEIIGNADAVQFTVKANATQTSNLTEWQDSSTNVMAYAGPSGQFETDYGIDLDYVTAFNSAGLTLALVNEAGNLGIGDYYYTVTYITAVGETNANNSKLITTTADNTKVDVTVPVSADYRVTGRKIYRSVVNGGQFSLFLLTTINDNTTTTYQDNIADGSLGTAKAYFRANTTNKAITRNGIQAITLDNNLTTLGNSAGDSLTSGGRNTYIGYSAGTNQTASVDTTVIGHMALYANTAGSSNTVMGTYTGMNTTGSSNVIMGAYAGFSANVSNNTFIGQMAGYLSTASNNVFLGYRAGYRQTTLSSLLIIDNQLRTDAPEELTNSILYGVMAVAPTSQTLRINALTGINTTPSYALDVLASGTGIIARFNSENITGCTLATGGTISCTSDEELKTNIEDLSPTSLSQILDLHPVAFDWKSGAGDYKSLGFLAGEVESIFPGLVSEDAQTGYLQLNTISLVPVLTRAIQEQQNQINSLASQSASFNSIDISNEAVSEDLDTRISDLEARILLLESNQILGESSVATSSSSFLNSLAVLGDSVLGDTVITGKLDVGILSFDSLIGSIDAIGKLKLQSLALDSIEFVGGSIEMDQKGNLDIKKGVLIGNDSFRGSVALVSGETSIEIERIWEESPLSVTATPDFNTNVWVTDKTNKGFIIHVDKPSQTDQAIDWQAIW